MEFFWQKNNETVQLSPHEYPNTFFGKKCPSLNEKGFFIDHLSNGCLTTLNVKVPFPLRKPGSALSPAPPLGRGEKNLCAEPWRSLTLSSETRDGGRPRSSGDESRPNRWCFHVELATYARQKRKYAKLRLYPAILLSSMGSVKECLFLFADRKVFRYLV